MKKIFLTLSFFYAAITLQAQNTFPYPSTGSIGLGTISPQALLHILSGGSSSNAFSQYTGDLIVQGNPGSRNSILGASLEFVIPANTDGSNPWGQGRIITVAGNNSSSDATGKMIFGTRRVFDKLTGTGYWNYGDDLVIDGSGRIGIGTLTPAEALSVNGNIRAKNIKVEMINWPDYVFKPSYKLLPLEEIKSYIERNHHLPEVPSEREIVEKGLNLGEMNKLLLKKVEELTLYLIDKNTTIENLERRLTALEKTTNHSKETAVIK